MHTVYKYEIDPRNPLIWMPEGAEILTVGFQGSSFCFWAKVDTEARQEQRNIHAFDTGHEMPYDMGIDWKYLGTGFMDNGLVFHAFESIGV